MFENHNGEETEEIISAGEDDSLSNESRPLKKRVSGLKISVPDKKTVKGFIAGAAATIVIAAALFCIPVYFTASSPGSISTHKKISQAMNIIKDHYIGDIDEQTLTDYMFLGLASGLEDSYSTYLTKEQYENISISQNGQYVGIGVSIAERSEDGEIEIVSVSEDGPADRAGIIAGDIIRSVDGTDTAGLTTYDVAGLIQGSSSDIVEISVYRESDMEELSFSLAKETLDSVIVSGEIYDNNTGRITISSFTSNTSTQFADILEKMLEYEVDGIVIDLRGNTGGLVSASCDVLRQIIPEGVLVYTLDKNGNRKEYTSKSQKGLDVPFAVLVDEKTASASEIFAGAIQDYDLAPIVGTQTFGKGIVQDYFKLSDGSVLKLTVSHYYTPNGNDIHGVGIVPDIYSEDDPETEEDEQLIDAVESLSKAG